MVRGAVELGRAAVKGTTNLAADVVEAPLAANNAIVKGLVDVVGALRK